MTNAEDWREDEVSGLAKKELLNAPDGRRSEPLGR